MQVVFNATNFDLNVTGPSLRGHIANEHMRPESLALVGVPLADISLANHLGFKLDWVVGKIGEKLSQTDQQIADAIVSDGFKNVLSVERYRQLLLKTLRCIEQFELAEIPWETVCKNYPTAKDIEYNPEMDSVY